MWGVVCGVVSRNVRAWIAIGGKLHCRWGFIGAVIADFLLGWSRFMWDWFFFFFMDRPPPEISTLPLPDPLPICPRGLASPRGPAPRDRPQGRRSARCRRLGRRRRPRARRALGCGAQEDARRARARRARRT